MKQQVWLVPILSLALSAAAAAQNADAVNQSTRDEVVRFLQLTQVRSHMVTLLDSMGAQQKQIAEAAYRQQNPNATPADIRKVDNIADSSMKAIKEGNFVDELVDAMIPIYQRHLNKDDLDAIIAFYSSPVGQKLQNENQAMAQEAMQASVAIITKKLPAITENIKSQVDKLAQKKQAPGGNPKNSEE